MSKKEEEFPFQEFVEALQQQCDLRQKMKPILTEINKHNIYWTYSALSTLVEILRSKDQQPIMKCRSLQVTALLLDTCEYSVVTFVQVYVLPILLDVSNYRGRKSQQLISYYFQQHMGSDDTPEIKQLSLQYVQRSVQMIFYCFKLKPYRTVEVDQLKQESNFSRVVKQIKEKGVQEPKNWKWIDSNKIKDCRKRFLQKMRSFGEQTDDWAQFLLVNLLQEVRTGKKQLLQLRQLLSYGESYLTSSVINVCQDQLLQMTQNLDIKRKYLSLLNQLVRYGDIEAIIMIKNSQFIPSIAAHISKVQGHVGLNQGEKIYPQIQGTKQVKRQFYLDFLRCLQTWASVMPQDYDSDQFTIKAIYQLLKVDKKFKFPQNLHLARFQKQITQNLQKNKQRNAKLIQILQNVNSSKQQSSSDQIPLSKVSNVLQRTTLLAPNQLQNRLQQAKRCLKNLIQDQPAAEKSIKILLQFKQNWITYLEALDIEGADEGRLQNLVIEGQKCVQQIQIITPHCAGLTKGKLTFKEFKERIKQCLDFQNDISMSKSQNVVNKRSMTVSKSIALAKSKMGLSKFQKSKMMTGKDLLDKIKSKSKIGDISKLDLSKLMDRSGMMGKSKFQNISKLQKSKNQSYKKPFLEVKKQSQFQRKELTHLKTNSVNEEDESMTNSYKIPGIIPLKTIEKQSPIQSSKDKNQNNVKKQSDYTKKQIQKRQASEEQKVIRIDDYEADVQKIYIKNSPNPHLETSRSKDRGSKILLRRNQNRSRLSNSESRVSQQRKSVSGKKVKQSSIFKRNNRQISKTKKISQIEEELLKDNKGRIDETIEINGNIINDGVLTQKKGRHLHQDSQFNNFKDGAGQISSIHSNSVLRVFHHSAEKILNITVRDKNQGNQYLSLVKDLDKQIVEYKVKPIECPLVGDYYHETQKQKIQQINITPRKQSYSKELGIKSKVIEEQKISRQLSAQQIKDKEDKKIRKTQTPKNNIFEKIKKQQQVKKQIQTSRTSGFERRMESEKNISPQKKNTKPPIPSGSAQVFVQLKLLQSEKNKEIEALQQKIKDLERETITMKTKLAAKDNELRSIKSKSRDGSERGFAIFTSPSQSNYDIASSRVQSRSQKTSLKNSSVGKKIEPSRFQKQVESGYKQYLQKIKGSTFRKSLLKYKCLVHKTDQIQIGCMSKRSDRILQSTLFVTPHHYDLIDFTIAMIPDHNLKIKIYPQLIKLIHAKKQHKITMTIQIIKTPFCLPEFQINYKATSEYSSNYSRLTLPIAFNKFCQITPMRSDSNSQRHLQFIRTDDFKTNSKVVKLQKIEDSFPNFTCIPANKDRPQTLLAAECNFMDTSFNLMLNLHEKNSFIQGFLLAGDLKAMNFLMCTLKEILDSAKK